MTSPIRTLSTSPRRSHYERVNPQYARNQHENGGRGGIRGENDEDCQSPHDQTGMEPTPTKSKIHTLPGVSSKIDHLQSFYKPQLFLVNDPNTSVIEGDIITLAPERHSKHVMYTVSQIVAPFGKSVEERPPLLTQQEREDIHAEKRARKLERRAKRAGSSEPVVDHGREVMEDGQHRFGKIHDESRAGSNRALRRLETARQHEKENEVAKQQDSEAVAKESLHS